MSGIAMAATQQPKQPNSATGDVKLKLADAVKHAQALFAKGKLDAAEQVAIAIVEKRPGQPIAVQLLAAIAEKRGNAARAIAVADESLPLVPRQRAS
ncbi:MAG: hypothetical protein K8S25_03275 [Alphaproteobacteria bacterium]|nr:hypothetical protein [Alphaproteobacteria bacterium]